VRVRVRVRFRVRVRVRVRVGVGVRVRVGVRVSAPSEAARTRAALGSPAAAHARSARTVGSSPQVKPTVGAPPASITCLARRV